MPLTRLIRSPFQPRAATLRPHRGAFEGSPLVVLAVLALTLVSIVGLAVAGLEHAAYLVMGASSAGAILALASIRFGARQVAIVGLITSIPLFLTTHLVYRDYIGAADGVTVELIDLWIVWLGLDLLHTFRNGRLAHVRSLAPFLLPLAILLVAELLSLSRSEDLALSVYGLLSHIRAAVLFCVLAVTLAQGSRERSAAIAGVLSAVLVVGGLCIVETLLTRNFRANIFVDEMSDGVFRAGALDTPTGTAAYLAALLPLVAIGYFFSNPGLRRTFASIAVPIGCAGLLCTITRGSTTIFLGASIPLLLFLYINRRIRFTHVLLVGAAVLFAVLGFGSKIGTRLGEGGHNLEARTSLNGTAYAMLLDSPLVGEGINNYWLKMDRFRPKTQTFDFDYLVHNKYLLTAAETGSLGLLAFVWLFTLGLVRAAQLARKGLPIGVGLFSAMISLVLTMNFEPFDNGPSLMNAWALLAIVAATWSSQPQSVAAPAKATPESQPTWIAHAEQQVAAR